MGKGITKKNEESDKKISNALMASFVVLTIQYLILIYFNLIGTGVGSRIQLISKGLVALAFLYALPAILKRSKIKFICAYSISAFIFLLHYAIFPSNRNYITELVFPFFFMSLPAFIYSLSINDLVIFKQTMKKTSYIIFIVGVIIGFLVFSGRASVGGYSMSLSYYILLPTILLLDTLIDEFSFKTLGLTGLSLLIILALGSRGAILCIIVFVFLKFISPKSKRTIRSLLTRFSILAFGVVSFIFVEDILTSIYHFLLRFGINSRSIILLLREDVHLSGRDRLYEMVIEEIIKHPILGLGLAGDTRVIGNSYVHNFFIEVIANFGTIIGSLLCIFFILFVIKSLFTKDKFKYNFLIIWLSLGFVHLIVSGSYLTDIKFWILIGLMFNFTTNNEIESSHKNNFDKNNFKVEQ